MIDALSMTLFLEGKAMIKLTASNDDFGGLPLILVTIGDDEKDFEALHDHLEFVEKQAEPRFQSLIVARPQLPSMLYKVLRKRVEALPNVYIRRLSEASDECERLPHATGTFLVSRRRLGNRAS